MNTLTLVLTVLSIALVGVTFHAWRLGNERRDVALLGAFTGLLGAGAAASVIL